MREYLSNKNIVHPYIRFNVELARALKWFLLALLLGVFVYTLVTQLRNLPYAVGRLIKTTIEELINLIKGTAPCVAKGAVELLVSLFKTVIPALFKAKWKIIGGLFEALFGMIWRFLIKLLFCFGLC